MDPKLAQNLDPKLQETYNRIMGTPVNIQSPPPPTHEPIQPQHVPVEQVVVPQAPPVEQIPSPTPTTAEPEMVSINATAPIAKPAAAKGKISPIIFVVLGVGFFLFYTVVWLKIFNIF